MASSTTRSDRGLPVPGWYWDPGTSSGRRWWDGTSWTGWVSDDVAVPHDDGSVDSRWAPPFPVLAPSSAARGLAVTSIVISVVTLACFIDLFAPFTAPVAVVLGCLARRSSEPGTRDRSRANLALWLAVGTIALWPLLIPLYNGMNAGL